MRTEGTWREQLRALRVERGITQPEAAARIGVQLSTYARWEQGRAVPRAPLIIRALGEAGFPAP